MSPSSAEPTAESRELKLVQDAEFRIIQSSVDVARLQNMFQLYLAPLILKTASQHVMVQTITIRVLRRLEAFMEDPRIVLPIEALLDQFKSNQSPIIKEFDLKFIKHSLDRIDSDQRRRLVPKALRGFALDWNHSTLGTLFLIILRLLLDIEIPPRGSKEEASFRNELGLQDPADAMRLIEAMGVLLRLRTATAQQDWSLFNPAFSRPNLSGATREKFKEMKLWDRIPEIKGRLIALLASGAFTDEEKFFPAICAASGTDLRAASVAEDLLKKTTVSMDNPDVVRQLSQAYFNLPVAHRIRILGMFCKSSVAANMTDWISDLAIKEFPAIYDGPDKPFRNPATWIERPSGALETNKLSTALFNFIAWTATTHTAPAGQTFMTSIGELITNFLKSQGWPRPQPLSPRDCDIRIKAYSTLGDVSRHYLVAPEFRIKLVEFLLCSLAFDHYPEFVVVILSSLSSLAMGIPREIGKANKSFKATLMKHMGDFKTTVRTGRPDEATDVVELGRQELVVAFFITNLDMEGPESDSDDLLNRLDNFQGSRIGALPIALRFCQQMLLLQTLNHDELKQDTLALEARVMTDLHLQFQKDDGLEPSESQREECLRCFIEVATLAPQEVTKDIVSNLDKLIPLVKSSNKNIRSAAARAAGILVGHTSNCPGTVRRWLESILKDGHRNDANIDINYNATAGYVLALGFVTSRCVYRQIPVPSIDWPFHILLDTKAPLEVLDAAMEGFSQAWNAGIGIPPVLGEHSLDVTIDFLKAQASGGNEKAIVALGSLGLGLPDQDDTMGRFEADYMKLRVDIEPELFEHMMPARTTLLIETLDKLLVKTRLPDIHTAFMHLIASRDDLCQETASRGHGPRLKVDKNTELFEPGALPTGQESSITTYQDIVSLANELGDQQIMYKLIFGLGNILSKYTRSMESLWKDTVKDPNHVLDEHFEVILGDLLESVLGQEWRVRQASCAAIADLLHGRKFEKYQHYYTRIWASALKVLDDVKGTLDEGDSSSSARAMMQEAMPFLMSDHAVASSVEDVRMFALTTVIKIAKRAGKIVQPFIPIMVPKLLDLLSLVEPEQINFQYQRLGEESRDEIDRLRSQAVNQSPIMEAVEECLRYINTASMSELLPVLEHTAKDALGLQTKIGCSRVFTTLAMQHNDEASRAYARAAAYMLKAIPEDESRVKFCKACVEIYVKSEDEARRQRVAQVVGTFSSLAPDSFSLVETILLPLAYHAGNARTAVRYIPEVVELAERCLGTGQWSLQHTAAFAMAQIAMDVADISDSSGSGIAKASLEAIWLVFDRCLALKTFAGKEKLLESLPLFLQQADALWQEDTLNVPAIKRIVLREAKRQNADYRIDAFRCLWPPFLMQLGKGAKAALEAAARGYYPSKRSDFRTFLVQLVDMLQPHFSSPEFAVVKRQVWYDCVCDLMADAIENTTAGEPVAEGFNGITILAQFIESVDVKSAAVGTEAQRMRRVNAVAAIVKAQKSSVFGDADLPVGLEHAVEVALSEEASLDVVKAWAEVLNSVGRP
ncbi:hypothetical protein CDD82_7027 [Ophiocordyceps australis]|uniref:Proteasome activator Blm10 mid region domain-containing protein n=1 Tax=Ophiocordyceps australis TaxID=1399860 RepID=A0A2C5ZLZ1_9HYPO|nr:hypothetical protein CDD82_7027 [Ophiocordyceps australis]